MLRSREACAQIGCGLDARGGQQAANLAQLIEDGAQQLLGGGVGRVENFNRDFFNAKNITGKRATSLG